MSHVTTTALTDFTKRKLRMYPGTLGRVHTVMKLTDDVVVTGFVVDCMFSWLCGGSPSSTKAPGTFCMGDSGGSV